MAKKSAGILLYRFAGKLKVLLVHPGGPFFRNKDKGSWTVPKGEVMTGEQPFEAALLMV
ncbi:NUDIX domain-containing protein [Pedobacter sp. PACM 27299]|uniref:NUDIX domain-containing protein n=1 Tax=Pedobacter sp. PACM 27299 TaxID=1727164 RepID=UPI001E3ECD27|nr:NUDIX domain-containing protein [Pedobacter sp. PACM 27299]